MPQRQMKRRETLELLMPKLKETEVVSRAGTPLQETLQAKFDVLEAVGLAIGSPLPLDMTLNVVMDLLLDVVPVEAATLFLVDPTDSNVLRFAVTRGPTELQRKLEKLRVPIGRGVVGWVVENNRYAIVNDVTSDPRFLPDVDVETGFRTQSVLCVPMRCRQEEIGALELINRSDGPFTEEDAIYVASVANQTAQLLANMQLFEERQRDLRTLHALRTTGKWLNSSLNIEVVLENLVATADEVIRTEAGSIMLLDDEGHLHFEVALGPRSRELMKNKDEIDKRLDQGIAGWVAQNDTPQLIPDCSQDPRFTGGPGAAISAKLGFVNRSMLVVPMRARDRVIGVLQLINKLDGRPFDEKDLATLSALADDAAAAITNAKLYEDLENSYLDTINSLATALDTRDNETGGHSQRVARYAQETAIQLGLSADEVETVYKGSLLHDVGKIGIPDGVLLKPGKLDDDEWAIMRRHAIVGYRILEDIAFLRSASVVPLFHHERYDGHGYLAGLKGEEIPLGARIFAVVDTFDAMTSDRVYRKALTFAEAHEEIRRCSGTQFDPRVVDAFLRIPIETINQIREDIRVFQANRPSLRAWENGNDDKAAALQAYERLKAEGII